MYFIISIFLLFISFIIAKINRKNRKYLIITETVIALVYIIWRITAIPKENALSFILGITLYIAEILGLINFLNFVFLFFRKYKYKKKDLSSFNGKELPSVDVLICTYNEPEELLEKTIVAAKNIRYEKDKKKIYVCDDGKRKNIEKLCKKYNVNWLTRDDNEGAKAGNINNALKIINGDLFVVLDADMIAKHEFLERTVGYFSDDAMAFVQTPQVYYNRDMYQYNLGIKLPNEQDFFMRDVEEARASVGAVLHVGTNAVFNRKIVIDNGGYPTISITEDMAVGMKLQSKGYKSIFINEELVLGLSATTFEDLVMQRDRWCRGNLQVIKKYNPLTIKGLSFRQRVAYFDGVLYWLSSIQKMIYILSPCVYILTGTLILDCTVKDLVYFYIPYYVGQIIVFRTLASNTRSLFWAHIYEVVMGPHIAWACIKEVFSLDTSFNVTPKDSINKKAYYQFNIVLPHIILGVISIICFFISANNILYGNGKGNLEGDIINLFWSIYNDIGILIALLVAYQKPIYRKSERIVPKQDLYLSILYNGKTIEKECKILDLNENGMKIKVHNKEQYFIGESIVIEIYDGLLKIPCRIIRKHKNFIGVMYKELSMNDMSIIMGIIVENMSAAYEVKSSKK